MDPQTSGDTNPRSSTPLATLRRFMRPRSTTERCEMCSAELPVDHAHLLDCSNRQLLCACDACALLLVGQQPHARYRRVPRRVEFWSEFAMTDAQWDSLHIPINLAFFSYITSARRVVALYPSPAGATESLLTLEAWQDLLNDNPALAELEPDVEALLVNRIGPARETWECYRVPIDECYKLVGIIRTQWRGLSGGPEVWGQIRQFFISLKARSSRPAGRAGGDHA